MEIEIKVVNEERKMLFENRVSTEASDMQKQGYEIEIQTHIEHARNGMGKLHYVAVVIGRKLKGGKGE